MPVLQLLGWQQSPASACMHNGADNFLLSIGSMYMRREFNLISLSLAKVCSPLAAIWLLDGHLRLRAGRFYTKNNLKMGYNWPSQAIACHRKSCV